MEKTFVREHYPWGRTVTYRLEDGTLEYHYGCGEDYRVCKGWQELKPLLLETWVPQAFEEVSLYERIKAGVWD
jgi:hypothetical protein